MKTKIKITNGCGKGQKCSVGLYIQPFSSTRDVFKKYAEDAIVRIKEDSKK